MVLEEVALNVTEGIEVGVAPVINFIRIVGGIFIVYIVFWIISVISNWRRNKYFKEFKACFVLNNGKVIQAQRAINKK